MKLVRHRALVTSCILLLALMGRAAEATELWADEEQGRSLHLNSSWKTSALASHAPKDPLLFPDRDTATLLGRMRLDFSLQYSETVDAKLAYEHRARWMSGGGGLSAGAAVLPSFAKAPWRIEQLDWELADHGTHFEYRHEIDRALVALHPAWGEVIIGRQAIGLGRSVLFGAVDVFSPFSPLEVDREWRRGVDAIRIEHRTGVTTSFETIAVAGRSWNDSAVLVRARGYLGEVDGELVLGKRGRDAMFGGVLSVPLGDAEFHSELALFHTPEDHPDGGLFGNHRLIAKAVVGASYTFDVGNGLTLIGEYHYSGFGMKRVEDAINYLRNAAYQERYLRGDTQILGQHALGLQANYPLNSRWNIGALTLISPKDGSGLFSPYFSWDISESATLRANTFLPWGPSPNNATLQSEYGSTPLSLFMQLSLYF